MNDQLTHAESVLLLAECQDMILERDAEIERLRSGIDRCHKMLLSEPDTKGALFKAENILRDLLVPNAPHEGPCAMRPRTVPLDAVVGPRTARKGGFDG